MENRIVPIDPEALKKGVVIEATRQRVSGANRFGRPYADPIDNQTFTDLRAALDWASQSPEYSHAFSIPLEGVSLSAELFGSRRAPDQEMLAIRHNGKLGESMRMVDGHHAVSTDYEELFDLIVDLEPRQLALFDRGVVWVDVHERNKNPILKFHINAGVHTSDELEEGIVQMVLRVREVVGDLIEGMGITVDATQNK